MKRPNIRIPQGIPCLIVLFLLFGYLSSVMGLANMLNTIMKTAHSLLLDTVFYLMGMCVITGALSKVLSEFGVVALLQKLLRPVMRPLYNLPGVAVLGCVMTFLSDNPAIITLIKNRQFARYFKKYQFISLANFGTSFGMGLLVIVFMVGQGYFSAPFIGMAGAIGGGIIATRLMQRFVCRANPEFCTEDAVTAAELEADAAQSASALGQQDSSKASSGTFVRLLGALLEGGKSGVDIGLAIIPGVLIICTLVMMFTFGGSSEGLDVNGNEIVVYSGQAYQGCALLPRLAQKISFVFHWLFGFTAPELIAFPITALGAVGAALSLIPEFTQKGIMNDNAVAVFTAMGMCWSGFVSTHTAMLDAMGYRRLLSRDFLSQIIGGICAGVIAHWLYVAIAAIGSLLAPTPLWNTPVQGSNSLSLDSTFTASITALDDSTYVVDDWFGVPGSQLRFRVNASDSSLLITNAYAEQGGEYYFVHVNPKAKGHEPAYAVLYPSQQFSECDIKQSGGYIYSYSFIYDANKHMLGQGYYELTWGKHPRQTQEMELEIQHDFELQRAHALQQADSILRERMADSIMQARY